VIASYPEENEYSYVLKETGRQGSLGSEILGRTNMVLDYRRERLFLKKGATFNNPFEHDMSGITVKMYPLDEKRFYISKIRVDSPAAVAGIQVLDEIIAVNKIPLDFWELSDLVKLFRSEPNRQIFLEIKRYTDENLETFKIIEINFKLKKQI
jgi:C-terminal processing protease CtpA/Prc